MEFKRENDQKRYLANKKLHNEIFREQVMPILQKEYAFQDYVDYESFEEGSKENLFDKKLGLDYITNGEIPLGIEARISGYDSITVRAISRGYKTELYKTLDKLNHPDFPLLKELVLTVQARTVFNIKKWKKEVVEIYIINTFELFTWIKDNLHKGKELTAKEDGNKFYAFSIDVLKNEPGLNVRIIKVGN